MHIEKRYPLLPLRDTVVFPKVETSIWVGRKASLHSVLEADASDGLIVAASQRLASEIVNSSYINPVGTLCKIKNIKRNEHKSVLVVNLAGVKRVRISEFFDDERLLRCETEEAAEREVCGGRCPALLATITPMLDAFPHDDPHCLDAKTRLLLDDCDDAEAFANILAGTFYGISLTQRQLLLEKNSVEERLEKLISLIKAELEISKLDRNIRAKLNQSSEHKKVSRPFVGSTQNQPKDNSVEAADELQALELKILNKNLPPHAAERIDKELKKLKMMVPMSQEAAVVRNYIDTLLGLPWGKVNPDSEDLQRAQKILDEDHFALSKPKERIVEFLAVRSLVERSKGPILCLVGPPGVGKTSLGASIARAMNREFVRISLGGVRDEAEIRGHRRTYIGAMPGKIISSLMKIKSDNPVFLLDEVDKLSSDRQGDPANALLEVLDPEQNINFNDHYVDLDYDLSNIVFIATANSIQGIPLPLLDRMELIMLEGYAPDEKIEIARKYLIPKQAEANGIKNLSTTFTKGALTSIIENYTLESGVRQLERELSKIARKVAVDYLRQGENTHKITAQNLEKYLGPPPFLAEKLEGEDVVGLTNGLAVTIYGGTILKNEVTLMPGKGKLILTGQLRDVMQESAQAALSYVRSRTYSLDISSDFLNDIDIHIHFPGGHMPKDGPSAGITMATSLVSALTQIPVRRDIAMTGEITLRGRVLPIGGLQAKLMAATRLGIDTVIIPKGNAAELKEIPSKRLGNLRIIPVDSMDEVLMIALCHKDPAAFKERLGESLTMVVAKTGKSKKRKATTEKIGDVIEISKIETKKSPVRTGSKKSAESKETKT